MISVRQLAIYAYAIGILILILGLYTKLDKLSLDHVGLMAVVIYEDRKCPPTSPMPPDFYGPPFHLPNVNQPNPKKPGKLWNQAAVYGF